MNKLYKPMMLLCGMAFLSVANGVFSQETCAEATAIIVDGDVVLGDNSETIDENDADNGGDGEGTCWGTDGTEGDVWFSFEGAGGLVDIETFCLTNTDTQMAVYEGCDGIQVGCDDDSAEAPNCQFMARIRGLCTELGTTYYIEVEGWNGATGTFNIGVTSSVIEPTRYCSDPAADQYVEFPEACWIEDNTTCTYCAPLNDTCAGAFPLATDGTIEAGINVCAQPDNEPSCESGTAFGVWYSFNSGVNNAVTLSLAASLTPSDSSIVGPEVALFSGACNNLTQLFCASGAQNESIISELELSTTYYVLVWSDQAEDQGEFTISLTGVSAGCTDETACNFDVDATFDLGCDYSCIGCLDETAFNYDLDFTVACEDCCAYNDECVNAQEITIGETIIGTNAGAQVSLPNAVGSATAPDVYFSFIGNGSPVDINTVLGGLTDTFLAIYDECSGNVLAFNDDDIEADGNGLASGIYGFCTTYGETYIIEVQSFSGFTAAGTFGLSVTTSDIVPEPYCSDPDASNFQLFANQCGIEDCHYIGCTDAAACNFAGIAIEDGGIYSDDGSCCLENCTVITLTDSFGDGWNGAVYTLTDINTDEVVSTGGLTNFQNNGDFVIYDECIPDGIYNLSITAGNFPSEIGFTIANQDGLIFEATNDLDNDDFAATDLIYSLLICIGTCESEPTCSDENALNYNPLAISDCSGTVGGTDFSSCCSYPEVNDECEGALPLESGVTEFFSVQLATNSGNECNPTAGDLWYSYTAVCNNELNVSVFHEFESGTLAIYTGSCGGLTEIGCFDPTQAGSVTISVTTGTTYYFLASINPDNFSLGLTGSILITEWPCEGCTDPSYENYNPNAIIDDGSCEGLATSCPGDFDFNGAVTSQDLSIFLSYFSTSCESDAPCLGDLNGDLAVTSSDLSGFLGVFGTYCE